MTQVAEYIGPNGQTRRIWNVSQAELEALHEMANAGLIPTSEDGFLLPATDDELKDLIGELTDD